MKFHPYAPTLTRFSSDPGADQLTSIPSMSVGTVARLKMSKKRLFPWVVVSDGPS